MDGSLSMSSVILLALLFPSQKPVADPPKKLPTPEKLVVLTFDDAAKSHFTKAGPLLKELGHGATFFVTEGFDFPTNKKDYMTWEEIQALDRMGFEIGNHTIDHGVVTAPDLAGRLRALNKKFQEYKIPKPVSFAYPGNTISLEALPILKAEGIRFARRGGSPEYAYSTGGGVGYEPYLDHPLLIPSAGDSRPGWKLKDFEKAIEKAHSGRIAVLQFHGVPDTAHNWVNTPYEAFEEMMRWLKTTGYTVIAMRDLEKYIDPTITPTDPQFVMKDRQARIASGKPLEDIRPTKSGEDRTAWALNMAKHRFTPAETRAVTGNRPDVPHPDRTAYDVAQLSWIAPYPGGRHPRTGFRDGAIRPQRETKLSFFAPWKDGGYAVLDLPEAIWITQNGGRTLEYLAHTHVNTIWDLKKVELPKLEWKATGKGFAIERKLPDGIVFRAKAMPCGPSSAELELEITNGSGETIRESSAQVCLMLAQLEGFRAQTNDNKRFDNPRAIAVDATGKRFVLLAFEQCQRAWGNAPCPCLHSDPAFGEIPPGGTKTLRGYIGFGENAKVLEEEASQVLGKAKP